MFIDTNVLVYALAPAAPGHDLARALLDEAVASGGRLTISRQILREYLATVTRPQAWGAIPLYEALDDVERFTHQFTILEDGSDVTDTLIASAARFLRGAARSTTPTSWRPCSLPGSSAC